MGRNFLISVLVFGKFFCWMPLVATADPSNSTQTLGNEELLNLAQQRSIDAVEVKYTMLQDHEGELPHKAVNSSLDAKFEKHILVDLKNGRFVFEGRFVTPTIAQLPDSNIGRQKTFWDRNSYVKYQVQPGSAMIDNQLPEDEKVAASTDPFLFAMLLYPPKSDSHGFDDGSLITLLRTRTDHTDMDQIDGRKCLVLDCRFSDGSLMCRAWLDVERSLAPVKLQSFRTNAKGTEVDAEWNMKSFVEMAGGGKKLWFPLHVDVRTPLKTAVINRHISIDKDNTRINPSISDASFRAELPRGTKVVDKVSKATYVIGRPQANERPVESRTGWHWAVWANIFIVAALCLLLFLRRRRRLAVS